MIPLLNQELHRLMSDSCYFTLEMNINDKNELEFLMIDNESRIVKSLNSGSGYEKNYFCISTQKRFDKKFHLYQNRTLLLWMKFLERLPMKIWK